MNRLKSIFISLSVSIWAFFSFSVVKNVFYYGYTNFSIGLILTSILPLGFFVILLTFKPVARTSKSLQLFTALIAFGFLLTTIGVYKHVITNSYLYMAFSSLVMWFVYVYWYSILPKRTNNLVLGSTLPILTFTNQKKDKISSTDFNGKKLLLMFYRGNWCPLCMAQIKEISSQYKELEKRGVEVLLISPQPARHSVNLAKKMKVKFNFLTDENNGMARLIKINQNFGVPFGFQIFGYKDETVLPTVIITDEQGQIIYISQTDNYRVRPEPSTFLDVLDKLEA